MRLDLRNGAQIRIPVEGAMNEGATGTIVGKRGVHYSVELNEKEGATRRLFGNWWVDCALRGSVTQFPVVNVKPKFKDAAKFKKRNQRCPSSGKGIF